MAREDGSKITDDKGSEVRSTAAAATAITLVLVSRVIMAVPGMSKSGSVPGGDVKCEEFLLMSLYVASPCRSHSAHCY